MKARSVLTPFRAVALAICVAPIALSAAAAGCSSETCDAIASSSDFGALLVAGAKEVARKEIPFGDYLVCHASLASDPTAGLVPDGPQALGVLMAEGGRCAPSVMDDACAACGKADCCVPSVTCFDNAACWCVTSCRSAGNSLAYCTAADQCGDAGAAYAPAAACLAEQCAEQCPRPQ